MKRVIEREREGNYDLAHAYVVVKPCEKLKVLQHRPLKSYNQIDFHEGRSAFCMEGVSTHLIAQKEVGG